MLFLIFAFIMHTNFSLYQGCIISVTVNYPAYWPVADSVVLRRNADLDHKFGVRGLNWLKCFLCSSITFRQNKKVVCSFDFCPMSYHSKVAPPLWRYVLRQPLNSASPHFWPQSEHWVVGGVSEWVSQTGRQGDGGRQKQRVNFERESNRSRDREKELWMDALQIALNHSTPLCLCRCVDTTSANTQGHCWLPLVINRWKMT